MLPFPLLLLLSPSLLFGPGICATSAESGPRRVSGALSIVASRERRKMDWCLGSGRCLDGWKRGRQLYIGLRGAGFVRPTQIPGACNTSGRGQLDENLKFVELSVY